MEEKRKILVNDADLEYVVRVCNHFWPARDKSAPAEESLGGQEIHNAEPDRRQSLVPLFFKKALERGTLLRRMQFYDEYLEAYNNHAYSKQEKLQDILRSFGLDSRKFWFLCLAARWQAPSLLLLRRVHTVSVSRPTGTALMPVARLQPTEHVPVPTVFWQTAVPS